MPSLSVVRGGASASPAGREFEIAYVDAESVARRLALIDAWSVPFEECMPVRGFPSYKGQRNHVGRWWTATTGSLVGYESWLERDWLMLLDFDPDVVGIAAQPFWLLWTTPEGKSCSHAPDFFARSAGGAALVMDCRPADRIKPRDGAVNLAGAQRDRGVQGLGGLGVGGMGQAAAVSPVTSFQTANRRVISVR